MTTQTYDQFINLHVHTDSSILDGFSTAKETVAQAAALNQQAIAFTDHGKLIGVYEGYMAAQAAGIKFIAGIEAYFTPSTTTHGAKESVFFGPGGRDDISGAGAYTHLTLFAENNKGLENLFKLNLRASTEGFHRKPRMSLEMLADHSEFLVATTGCPSGEVQTRLRLGQYDEAVAFVSQLIDILGHDNVYVELMDHGMKSDLERGVRADLLRIAQDLNLPLLATNDSHYASPADVKSQEEMLAIQTGALMSELPDHEGGKRFAFEGDSYYLKTAAEMLELFPEDKYPGAVSNTVKLAERCNITITPREDLRPVFALPDGFTDETEFLKHLAYKGFKERLPHLFDDPKYNAQLELELGVIIPKNFSNYFLVTADLMQWARNNGIAVGSGRGSAGGSFLAFVMYITDVDPIKHDLLFERFLNPERDSPPDVDLDFDDRYRDRVYAYVVEKYGYEHVAQVLTKGSIKGKNSIKDEARIFEFPYALSNELTKAYPPDIFGKSMKLNDIYDPSSVRYDEADSFREKVIELNAQKIVESALKLEGRTRSTGVHACAVLISGKPLTTTVPLEMRQKDEILVAQWEYPSCEAIGLLKMDFLGLRNLGIVDDCVALIKKNKGITVDLDAIKQGNMDDPKTYKLLADGNTLGIFQLDGGPMRDLLKMMKPDAFKDIAAVLALYRPGPMGVNAHTDYALRKNDLQDVSYIHSHLEVALKPILEDTYGLIVYQEQIMKLAQVIAGYSLGEADLLRRAMGKKKKSEMDMQWERFSTGAYERGYSKESIQVLWDTVLPFADYAFNKSHSVAYGYMSYITAYLKANFPAEYMSALLTSTADSTEKTALYLDDAKQNKIQVLPPDINHSVRDYSPLSDTKILFGLKALKGVSDSVSDTIVAERTRNGTFVDFSDVMNRLPRLTLNKRVLEAFGYGGAFDGMGYTRKSVIDSLEDLLKNYQKYSRAQKKQETMGASLFDELDFEEVKPRYEITPCEEYPNLEKLFLERQTLGLYVSGHPLDGLNLDSIASTKVGEILLGNVPSVEGFAARGKEPIVTIAGIAGSWGARVTKAGKPFGSGMLEDRTGSIDFVMFSNTFTQYGSFMKTDGLYALTGYPQKRGEGFSFIVNSVRPLEFAASGNMPVRLKLTQDQWEKGYHAMVQRLMVHENSEAKEATDVVISIRDFDGSVTEETLAFQVKPGTLLVSEMRELFGMGCIGRWRPRKPVTGPVEE
jgi:DNA polymerase-3 subunit alpha